MRDVKFLNLKKRDGKACPTQNARRNVECEMTTVAEMACLVTLDIYMVCDFKGCRGAVGPTKTFPLGSFLRACLLFSLFWKEI